jgi:hypothetical protein
MKTLLQTSLAVALLLSSTVFANEIIVLKGTDSGKGTFYNEDDPGTPNPIGYKAESYSSNFTAYYIIDKTSDTYFTIPYGTSPGYAGYPARKFADFSQNDGDDAIPSSLEDLFGPDLPLRGGVLKLWNNRSAFQIDFNSGEDANGDPILGIDEDGDGTNETFGTNSGVAHVQGTASPLKLNDSLTLPSVPSKLTGLTVRTRVSDVGELRFETFDDNGDPIGEEIYPPYRSFSTETGTINYTLDMTLTKAANLTPSTGTDDVYLSGPLAAGTIENGLQQVRNALNKLGFKLPPPLVDP